jgi:hypothetical protein
VKYYKLLWALGGTLAYGLQTSLSGGLSGPEIAGLVAMLLTALGTWLIPNTPQLATAKTWVAALVVGAGVLGPGLADGWQPDTDLWPVLIAVLTAAGVYVLPKPDTNQG